MVRSPDLSGQKFGMWTVIQRSTTKGKGSFWDCVCDCGTERSVRGYSLTSGSSTGCGCLRGSGIAKAKAGADLTGESVGRWTVIGKAPYKRRERWFCRCSCGALREVNGSTLRNGSSLSCGCLAAEAVISSNKRREHITAERRRESVTKRVVEGMRRQAAVRGYEWSLEESRVRALIFGACYLCGETGGNKQDIRGHGGRKANVYGVLEYNGIDRIENEKGYVEGNVLPCCGRCNLMKRTSSIADLVAACRSITQRYDAGLIPDGAPEWAS